MYLLLLWVVLCRHSRVGGNPKHAAFLEIGFPITAWGMTTTGILQQAPSSCANGSSDDHGTRSLQTRATEFYQLTEPGVVQARGNNAAPEVCALELRHETSKMTNVLIEKPC